MKSALCVACLIAAMTTGCSNRIDDETIIEAPKMDHVGINWSGLKGTDAELNFKDLNEFQKDAIRTAKNNHGYPSIYANVSKGQLIFQNDLKINDDISVAINGDVVSFAKDESLKSIVTKLSKTMEITEISSFIASLIQNGWLGARMKLAK